MNRNMKFTIGFIGLILGYQASRIKDLDRSLAMLSYNMDRLVQMQNQRNLN